MLAATLSIVSGLTPPKGGIIPAEDIYLSISATQTMMTFPSRELGEFNANFCRFLAIFRPISCDKNTLKHDLIIGVLT